MKRSVFLLAALLAGVWTVSAQDTEGILLSESRIPGVYQRCTPVTFADGDTKFKADPFLKIYNPDGSFYTVLALPERTMPAILTNCGTYRILSEKQLVESLSESFYDSHKAGDESVIDYAVDEKVLYFVFPSGAGVGREAWYAIGRPAAAPEKSKIPAKAEALAAKIVGVWQLSYSTAEGKRVYAPVYKIYRADGTFTTLSITSQSGLAAITAQGTYRVKDGSKYEESVLESATDPDLAGSDTAIECNFTDDAGNAMRLTLTLEGRDAEGTEEWSRVRSVERNPAGAENVI